VLFLLSRRAEDRTQETPTDLFGEMALPRVEGTAKPRRKRKA